MSEVKMPREVLCELTEDHLETGLRGVPVGVCTTSTVDPQKGLFYCRRPIAELAERDPLDVIFLLAHGRDARPEELETFTSDIHSRASCSPKLIKHIRELPRDGHPMKLFCAALLLAGMIEGKNDYREDCLNVIAKIPEIVAHVINHHAGWEPCKESNPELGYMENFTHMLNVPGVKEEDLSRVFRLFNVLHYDHGGGNCSTFTGKTVASALEDMWGSLSAAMCALAGPRHGKANQDCLTFVKEVLSEVGEDATAQQVENLVRKRLDNRELVFGFGHAVLRVEDARATILYEAAQEMYPKHPLVKIASLLRTEGPKVLKENPRISNPYPNVDAISGTVLTAAGFPFPEYYTVLFGLSRVIGIAMQIVYERCVARDGKGTPIMRPKYFYKDPQSV